MAAPPIAAVRRLSGRARGALAVLVVVLLALLGWWGYTVLRPQPVRLVASGTLEADETLISAQVTATIRVLPAHEGDRVQAGDVVAQLDDRLLSLQILEADVATRRTLELQRDNYVLRSPVAGTVSRAPARAGETAMPGQVLLAIAPTDRLKVTLYVREAELGSVSVGQPLAVTADPFPARVFAGQVTSINPQAEFTPRNVQTASDRLNLVFGVRALVSNPDGALKPGMPVDAQFMAARP